MESFGLQVLGRFLLRIMQLERPSMHLHLSRFGGHMGYLSANLPDRCYMDYAIGHYLDELLKL